MNGGISAEVLFSIGPIDITDTVVTSWTILLLLGIAAWAIGRSLREDPGRLQTAVEGAVLTIQGAVQEVLPVHAMRILPFIGTLWIYLLFANLAGVIPGLHSPTRDLSATTALALLVFLSVHWFGIRIQGPRKYFAHYLSPSPILLPFHVISEITRTVALAVRLFGNMMSLEMAALMILMVAGFLAPVPILMLHIVEAVVQAYIFGTLALIYLAGGIQSYEAPLENEGESNA